MIVEIKGVNAATRIEDLKPGVYVGKSQYNISYIICKGFGCADNSNPVLVINHEGVPSAVASGETFYNVRKATKLTVE